MRRSILLAALLTATVLTLQGCGGSVALRSSFTGPSGPPPTAGSPHPGLHAKGGGALAAALVLGLLIVDAIDWAAQRLGQDSDESRAPEPRRPLFQRIDRGWVDRGP